MGLLVSFVSPLSHENGEHARRRPNGGYANPAEPAIGRAPGTSPPCAEGDASRDAGRAGRGRLAVWAAFAGINASICCHQRRESGSGMRSRRVGQPSVVNPSLRHTRRRPGPASPSPRSRDGDPNAANCPTSRSADSSDTANPTSTDGSKTTPSTRRNDGNQKKRCTRCVPDGQAPEKIKGRNR